MTTYDLRPGATFDTTSSCSDHSLSTTNHDVEYVEPGTDVLESIILMAAAMPTQRSNAIYFYFYRYTSPTHTQQQEIDSKKQRQRIGMLVVGVSYCNCQISNLPYN